MQYLDLLKDLLCDKNEFEKRSKSKQRFLYQKRRTVDKQKSSQRSGEQIIKMYIKEESTEIN